VAPIALSDSELAEVQAAANGVPYHLRSAFLEQLAVALPLHSDLHRLLGAPLWAWPCCADIHGQITNSYARARERELAAALKGNGHDRDSGDVHQW
jgi:hypothetical protein